LRFGQAVTYTEGHKGQCDQKTKRRHDEERISGTVEYLCEFYAVIRDKKGVAHSFTATDVFTNDVVIDGVEKRKNLLAEILGLKDD
jgi:hypothetical protein